MIAEMVLGYETSKLLVMQAAWLKNEGKRNTRETSLAKWHATESAFRAAHLAIQVHGAYGYSAEYGIERYFRNARAPIIYEGTTQVHKMMQAEHALGLPRSERAGRRRLADRRVGAGPRRPGLATPGPVFRASAEPCSHRVLPDVADRFVEMLLVGDHPRGESLGEEVPRAPWRLLNLRGVVAVELPHAVGEVLS